MEAAEDVLMINSGFIIRFSLPVPRLITNSIIKRLNHVDCLIVGLIFANSINESNANYSAMPLGFPPSSAGGPP